MAALLVCNITKSHEYGMTAPTRVSAVQGKGVVAVTARNIIIYFYIWS